MNSARVVELTAVDTHDLRRRVLRAGDGDANVVWVGDDDADTVHLGIIEDGTVIAVSTWLTTERRAGGAPRTIQLRGMATEPARVGTGLGRRLLRAGMDRAAASGADLVWANARLGALGFYERAGFTPVGSEFVIAEVGLVHQRVEHPFFRSGVLIAQ